MSSTTWTPRAVASEAARVRLAPWRAVEAQHIASTRRLVDSAAEQEALEAILERAKPPAPARLHYLLATPFRYPPWSRGSRFRSPADPGVLYAAEERRTACAEVGYWRWRFLTDSAGLSGLGPSDLVLATLNDSGTSTAWRRSYSNDSKTQLWGGVAIGPLIGGVLADAFGFRIPFLAGHERRMPRLTTGPFRYQRYADSYLDVARRFTRRPLKQAVISASALSLMYPADGIPGRPAPEPPMVERPVEPREPLPPKPDQSGPATVSPTASESMLKLRREKRPETRASTPGLFSTSTERVCLFIVVTGRPRRRPGARPGRT